MSAPSSNKKADKTARKPQGDFVFRGCHAGGAGASRASRYIERTTARSPRVIASSSRRQAGYIANRELGHIERIERSGHLRIPSRFAPDLIERPKYLALFFGPKPARRVSIAWRKSGDRGQYVSRSATP
jgi:hypothetical protein